MKIFGIEFSKRKKASKAKQPQKKPFYVTLLIDGKTIFHQEISR